MAGLAHDPGAETTTLAEDLRALLGCPRELILIFVATFFEYVGVFSFLVTLPLWLSNDFGMSDKTAGFWAATFSTLVTLFVFLVGSIADSVGVRTTLIFSFAFAAATRLGMSLSTNSRTAIATLLAFAFAYATTSPVLQTAVQRASSRGTRAFAFTLWYVSFNLGGVVSGLMVDAAREAFLDHATGKLIHRSLDLPLIGARTLTAQSTILGLGFLSATVAVFVVLLMRRDFEHRPEPGESASPPSSKPRPLQALREVVAHKAFWRFMLLLVLLSLVKMMFQHMQFTWPKYVIREQGDAFPVGKVWGLNSLLILGLAPLCTAVFRRRRPLDVLLIGAAISSVSPFVLMFGSSMPYQLAMVLILTVGEAMWSPRLYEYNVSIAPRGREATYVSLAALPTFLAKFIVGPTSGYLLDAYCPAAGPRHAWMIWAIIGLSTVAGPVVIWFARGFIDKRDDDVPDSDPDPSPAVAPAMCESREVS